GRTPGPCRRRSTSKTTGSSAADRRRDAGRPRPYQGAARPPNHTTRTGRDIMAPGNRDEIPQRHRAAATRAAVDRIAERFRLGVVYAQDYADLLDARHQLGPLAALATVAAE